MGTDGKESSDADADHGPSAPQKKNGSMDALKYPKDAIRSSSTIEIVSPVLRRQKVRFAFLTMICAHSPSRKQDLLRALPMVRLPPVPFL